MWVHNQTKGTSGDPQKKLLIWAQAGYTDCCHSIVQEHNDFARRTNPYGLLLKRRGAGIPGVTPVDSELERYALR